MIKLKNILDPKVVEDKSIWEKKDSKVWDSDWLSGADGFKKI